MSTEPGPDDAADGAPGDRRPPRAHGAPGRSGQSAGAGGQQGRDRRPSSKRGADATDRGAGRSGGGRERFGDRSSERRSGPASGARASGRRPERDARGSGTGAPGGRGRGTRGEQAPARGGSGGWVRGSARADRPGRPAAGEHRRERPEEPWIPEDVTPDQLDRSVRGRLRTLSKQNADRVAQHLVLAGRLLEDDPEQAYEHAQAAVRRAGRVDVVREAAALTAYATSRYAEALRELRTVRRLSGIDAHRAIEADCERGLGRPDRALTVIAGAPEDLSAVERAELAIVASGARLDLGEGEAALSVLDRAAAERIDEPTRGRLEDARHSVLVALGRAEPDERDEESAPVPAAATGPDPSDDVLSITDVTE